MRFGTKVQILRGSADRLPGTKGCLREVKGTLVGYLGPDAMVRLDEDDLLGSFWTKRGDVGHWGKSTVKLAKEEK
jgi:hypothetical protein